MIVILVQHFLNDEGQQGFGEWVENLAQHASRYEGFIAARPLILEADPTQTYVLLEWENDELLDRWLAGPERVMLLDQQAPHRLNMLTSTRYTTETVHTAVR